LPLTYIKFENPLHLILDDYITLIYPISNSQSFLWLTKYPTKKQTCIQSALWKIHFHTALQSIYTLTCAGLCLIHSKPWQVMRQNIIRRKFSIKLN